jgi:methylmalonyl-CoA mutase
MSTLFTNEFMPSSAAAWKQKIQFELDGADYQTVLTKTNEGITIKPFYHANDFEKVIVPLSKEDYKICTKIIVSSEEIANIEALSAIEKGATAILFEVLKPFNSFLLFKNLVQKNIEFHFRFSFLDEDFINKLLFELTQEKVYFNIDIIGNLAKTGNWFVSLKEDNNVLENLIKNNSNSFLISVDATIYQNAGANTVQQIAYALAHANEYLTKFGAEIATKIQFNFATGSNYFFEIAKIRAFRYLYNLILSEYNTTAIAKIYAEPTLRNKTLYGSSINTLRVTTESISAIIGGATTIATNFTSNLFSQNQQQILNEISTFKNTQHVVTNSYYIESLTKQLAEKALTIFKDIEKSGGFLNQLKEGTIQRKIKENAQKEEQQFELGELVLLEVNKYPNLFNSKKDVKINPFVKRISYKTLIIPITPKRLAEKLEQNSMRDGA